MVLAIKEWYVPYSAGTTIRVNLRRYGIVILQLRQLPCFQFVIMIVIDLCIAPHSGREALEMRLTFLLWLALITARIIACHSGM
jgi:hypothetical protein